MKKLLLFFFLFVACLSSAQDVSNGCIIIDFEEIEGEALFEGLRISDQFYDAFGLSFRLETGGVPVLAEVGPPVTAFATAFGSDEPAPGQEVGRFFLTDNGVLSGLEAPPVILEFETPIDSFAGCIIDMDFDEFFIIHARDAFDQIILADTIYAGDPGTGDGLSTCWGFNLPGCLGAIYSIRFAGSRTTSGGFGLALDNFSFCYSGLNVAVVTQDPGCVDTLGSIQISNTRPEEYEYAIDGGPYSSSGFFDNLPVGTYDISVLDNDGCAASIEVAINPPFLPEITDLTANPTSCALDNGSIQVFANGSAAKTYSIDGIDFQPETVFRDLPPGDYLVRMLDANGCTDSLVATVLPSLVPAIDTVLATDDLCRDSTGTVSVIGSGGTGTLSYSLNEGPFQSVPFFEGLPPGNYRVALVDDAGCMLEDSAFIGNADTIAIANIEVVGPSCESASGVISFEASGGTGRLAFSIDGGPNRLAPSFGGLDGGVFNIDVIDEIGCDVSFSVSVPLPICPVFVPNVFTPNGDGVNEQFQIFTNLKYDVDVLNYAIFDRWGELLYESGGFTILTGTEWWDGTFKGEPMMVGVYVYVIEVEHYNGKREAFKGDVTLVR
ncbi:MAG: gliding motility-associated C-terminal domain-containing protein [Bacteroidota bacterium]